MLCVHFWYAACVYAVQGCNFPAYIKLSLIVGMQNLGVKTAESYDERGASRFHALAPWAFIKQQFPKWYLQYDSHGAIHVSHTAK